MSKLIQKNSMWTFAFVLAVCGHCFGQQNPTPFSLQSATQTAVDIPPGYDPTASPAPTPAPILHDSQQRIVIQSDKIGTYGMRYDNLSVADFSELVDVFGNRTRLTKIGPGAPVEAKHEFNQRPVWYERFARDTSGGVLLSSIDEGESTLGSKAAQFGIQAGYPDWLRINFAKATTINEVDVITLQDYPAQNLVPLRASQPGGPTKFTLQGMTDYEVQYLDAGGKWAMIPGTYTTNNFDVARAFVFAPITTTAIRLVTKVGINAIPYPDYTRIVEVEAFEQSTHRNVALASQGATATASSDIPNAPAAAAIDGDETGKNWGNGGGWRDNTPNARPAPGTVQTADLGNKYSQVTYQNQFAKVVRTTNNNPRPPYIPQYQSFLLEKTDVTYASGYHTFTASANMTPNGIEYWDSAGGSRIQYYDTNKHLFYVSDWCDAYGTRPVVRVNRDSQGRPTDVYLGSDIGLLQFNYDNKGWAQTRLINRNTNATVWRLMRREFVDPTRSKPMTYPEMLTLTTGYLPQYGPIVEWHDSISPIPNIICSIQNAPYALLRNVTTGFASGEAARYVIYPFADEKNPFTNIRVEYDANAIYLYVPSLNSGSMILQNDMRAIRIPRESDGYVNLNPPSGSRVTKKSEGAKWFHRAFSLTALAKLKELGESLWGFGSGEGGSGGAQGCAADPAINGPCFENEIVVDGGNGGLAPGYIPAQPSGGGASGGGSADTDPLEAPTPPGSAYATPTPPTEPCDDTQNGPGQANPTGSWTGVPDAPGTTSACPACPKPSFSTTKPQNCPVITPDPNGKTPLEKDLAWAKSHASKVRKNRRFDNCLGFLRAPGSYIPFDANGHRDGYQTYLQRHGYTGDKGNASLNIPKGDDPDKIWNSIEFCDGAAAGMSACPKPAGPGCKPCGASAVTTAGSRQSFLCPDAISYLANQSSAPNPNGGPTDAQWGGWQLQEIVLHEFLHSMGLPEDNPSDADPSCAQCVHPSSDQINAALNEACLDSIKDAQGTDTPPH